MAKLYNKELSYDGGWVSKEELNFWGNKEVIDITFSAEEDDEINDAQKKCYDNLKENISNFSNITYKKALEYVTYLKNEIISFLGTDVLPDNIADIMHLHYVLITEEGKMAFCFVADWDDHGVTIVYNNDEEILIGTDDEMWIEL